MVIRKLLTIGSVRGVTLPPPFLREAKISRGDPVTIELGANNEIIIKKLDIKKLVEESRKNGSNKNSGWWSQRAKRA